MPLDEAQWTFLHLQEVVEAFDAEMRARNKFLVERPTNVTALDIGDYTYFFAFNHVPRLPDFTPQHVEKEEYL